MDILGTQTAQKMAILGHFRRILKHRSATCESRPRPPPLSFLLKLCVIVLHTHRYHPPKFQPNPKHHDGILISAHFARAAACLLAAAAKPCRSTVDTKKGYKTKIGSTSSVTSTLTLTLTPPPPHPWLDAPPTPGRYPPSPDPRQDPPPHPRLDPPPIAPPPPPPPQVLTDSWAGCRIRTSGSRPPHGDTVEGAKPGVHA